MIGQEITRNRWDYERLMRTVQPRCGRKGPDKAKCILLPGHRGNAHEGNGYDQFGPMYKSWNEVTT